MPRFLLLLAAACSLLISLQSQAQEITLTFDSGNYDPDMNEELSGGRNRSFKLRFPHHRY